MTMTLVETVTVGSGGAASIEFTGIAGTAKDLVLLLNSRSSQNGNAVFNWVQFNSDTGSNYTMTNLYGDGTNVSTNTLTGDTRLWAGASPAAGNTANTFGNAELYVSNYASSVAKSVSSNGVSENNGTEALTHIGAGLYTGTAAITSLKVLTQGNFAEHSTASLYSIS